ncbi:hypothetical protein SCLCIDRAFT_1219630 [Scleroderma citrinum Foug A]|uniref:Uncharacterized protein n=1 Tax=Scleroderma citrinum Foug A TaxID=1036808 RepID=A0A0C3DMD2_9AGAM|nr:hypothetical protein SCLCIDRAFT_1219630 [Scleroderma citrinum Foug A]
MELRAAVTTKQPSRAAAPLVPTSSQKVCLPQTARLPSSSSMSHSAYPMSSGDSQSPFIGST